MTRKRSPQLLTITLLGLALAVTATAASRQNKTHESRAYLNSYNLPSSGVALEGYCPVAYFLADKAIKGSLEYASEYNGVTYYFVSADAKKLFDADPDKYVPAYGGWCAFGMAVQDKFPVDPTNFKIVDGRLLVFHAGQRLVTQPHPAPTSSPEDTRTASAFWFSPSVLMFC